MNITEAQEVLLRTHLAALAQGTRPNSYHLVSPPGVGKSDGVRSYAARAAQRLGEPVAAVTFLLASKQSVDVRGFGIPSRFENDPNLYMVFSLAPWFPVRSNVEVVSPDGTWTPIGEWRSAVPRVGVLFLDEFSQADDDVKKAAAELILHGQVEACRLPPAWRVVSAGNRMSDRSGVVRELMFIVNRRGQLTIEPSLPAWLGWVGTLPDERRPHYLTVSFAQKNPDIVFRDSVPDGTDPFCTPRSLVVMDQELRALRSKEDIERDRLPLDPIAREVAAGWIGTGSAAQFYTHIKFADELPDWDDVIASPDKAKMPKEKSAQMVCAYMLAHNVAEDTIGQVIKYAARMAIEMQVLMVHALWPAPSAGQASPRAQRVMDTRGMQGWLLKHKDLLIASES